jgi:hypothetical protein
MNVSVKFSSLKDNTAAEYATRFLFGGLITILAGVVAKHFGPVMGGLLLAFPAIFPASATLLEDHEKKKMQNAGADGATRGRAIVAVDAEGTTLGCVGLAAFALVVWRMLPGHALALTLVVATAAWFVVASLCWILRRRF